MNIRTLVSIPTFLITFSIAIMFVTVIPTKKISQFFKGQNDLQAQNKIYNFLKNDRQLTFEMSEKLQAEEIPARIHIIKQYNELREKQDVSQLPKEFQYAWEKSLLNDVEWANFVYHLRLFNQGEGVLKTEAQKEIVEAKIAEGKRFDYAMQSVAESYGVEFSSNGNLIEK